MRVDSLNSANQLHSEKTMPPFPEALFPLRDGRSEKVVETDLLLAAKSEWIKERVELGWSQGLPIPIKMQISTLFTSSI